MIAFSYYLLKVIICSGLMYGYYVFALRNKLYHQWNRFYLLAAVVLSLTLPLVKISVWQSPEESGSQVVKILQVVNAGDEYVSEIYSLPEKHISTEQVIAIIYVLVCLGFLFFLIRTFLHIRRLIIQNPLQQFDEFNFVNTEARGTPFSFLNYIFWNRNIEPDSDTGQQIMKHELAHVREKHTHDKIFINIALIFFWVDPFFWLIRKEMAMIHEFIADQKSVEQGDTRAFAAMILQSVYPHQQFSITNNFFYSPLKRRLLMLTKLNNPKTSYISRLLVLPLLCLLIFAFTLRVKNERVISNHTLKLDQTFTVIVNASHGGSDNGAVGSDGILEKDLSLAISKKIRDLNTNPNLKIILTREGDEFQNVREIVDTATSKSPGAFVSIHMNAAEPIKTEKGYVDNPASGFEIYISQRNKNLETQNILLGSILTEELKKSYAIEANLKRRQKQGVWILDAPSVNYPAVLIECGYITNKVDLAFIRSEKNQEKIARNILDGIERYVASRNTSLNTTPSGNFGSTNSLADTSIEEIIQRNKKRASEYLKVDVADIKSINFQGEGENLKTLVKMKDKTTREISYADSKRIGIYFPPPPPPPPGPPAPPPPPTALKMPDGIKSIDLTADDHVVIIYNNNNAERITRQEAIKRNLYPVATNATLKNWNFKERNESDPLIILNERNLGRKSVANLDTLGINPEDITEIQVLKNDTAIAKYGDDAKNGVVIIKTKSKYPGPIFYKVEQEPEFPGGKTVLARYISEKMKLKSAQLGNDIKKNEACTIQFMVDKEGNLSNFNAVTLAESKSAQVLIEIISTGPKWKPAKQNGYAVNAYHTLTYSFSENNK